MNDSDPGRDGFDGDGGEPSDSDPDGDGFGSDC